VRYYEIKITDPANPGSKPQIYTSWVNNKNDPGALNIRFSFRLVDFASKSASVVAIYGIPIQSISNAHNLNGKNVAISAGFKQGLPLASPAQAGLILQGFIAQAYGNWIGNEMSLNLIILPGTLPGPSSASSPMPPTGSMEDPINGRFDWLAGTQLSTSITNFLTAAFPAYPTPYVSISPNLVINHDEHAVYHTLSGFADWVGSYSQSIINKPSYQGVKIRLLPGNNFNVTDGTTTNKTVNIEFRDLIGQPTWLGPGKISFKCPMRADINAGNDVVLPKGTFPVATPEKVTADWNIRNSSLQQGTFNVVEVQHFGDFRQPSADAWVSVFSCLQKAPS